MYICMYIYTEKSFTVLECWTRELEDVFEIVTHS